MKLILIINLLFFSVFALAQDFSSLCEESNNDRNQISFSQGTQERQTNEFTIITWNAQKYENPQFLKDFKKLAQQADLFLFQEAMHTSNLEKSFIENAPFDYSFHKSFCTPSKSATGVMSSARYELMNNQTLLSPDTEPITLTHKVSAYSQIVVKGQLIHVINTHALNFNLNSPFERQIYSVAKLISTLEGPVIWAGDFNTWNSERKLYLNQITAALKLNHLKPLKDPRKLVLDHIYVRGFKSLKTEVLNYNSSDHLPLKAVLQLE